MKKITSLILGVCILITGLFAFTSCFHKCDFSGDWKADNISHWHECASEECAEIADKADHVWNEGEITTKATQEADGTKTYTCETCRTTKPEAVVFTGLTEEEWNEIFSADNFDNFTYTETAVVKGAGFEMSSTNINKYGDGKISISLEMLGQTQENVISGEEADATKKLMQESIFAIVNYENYEYDAENKVYKLVGDLYIASLGTNARTATLRFENGLPVELIYTGVMETEGVKMEYISTITLSDFGTTEVSGEEKLA